MQENKLKKALISVIIFIFVVNYLAMSFHWYSSIWFSDILLHSLGGFWLGLLYFYLFKKSNRVIESTFLLILFVIILGVGWEIFEIFLNKFITLQDFNYLDSASDICFDLVGGLYSYTYLKNHIMINSSSTV